MERHSFEAMGTTVECLLEAGGTRVGARAALRAVEAEFDRLEAMLSRFRPDSELSRLNRDGQIDASPELLELTSLALDARERTEGRFDPTVHDALVAAGYDRTFARVAARPSRPAAARPGGGCVRLERGTRRIVVGAGARLDLGGIAKGWVAERTCGRLAEHGACLVNAGGDIAVRGLPSRGTWPVGLDTPAGRLVLGLSRGGLATSGSDRRRWGSAGRERHHLIDPATGRPSASDVLRVTLVADSATEAEVWATALHLAGVEEGLAIAEQRAFACVLVSADGRVVTSGAL